MQNYVQTIIVTLLLIIMCPVIIQISPLQHGDHHGSSDRTYLKEPVNRALQMTDSVCKILRENQTSKEHIANKALMYQIEDWPEIVLILTLPKFCLAPFKVRE